MYLLFILGFLLRHHTQIKKIVLHKGILLVLQKYTFAVDAVKRLIGIVAGIFCTLVVAELCSYCFKIDLKWYISLVKPPFCVSSGWMTCFVAICYISTIITIAMLVEHKWFFPSMIFFVLLGVFCILFVFAFFTCKNILLALVFMTFAEGLSFGLLIRFLSKKAIVALAYLPSFLFNSYSFLVTLCITLAN